MLSDFSNSIIAVLIDLGFLAAEAIPNTEENDPELAKQRSMERVLRTNSET
jgi:hypothetical protein